MQTLASIFIAATFAIGIAAAPAALSQAYPNKPLRILVPLPAGSLTDRIGRILAQPTSAAMGQPIVVDNRGGANGNLGMDVCARSGSDGYTICMPDGNIMTLNPFAYAKLTYEPLDFVPIIHVAELEQGIVVQSALPVRNVKELIDYARARPGQVTWGSAGNGSTMHLYMEWLQAKTGVKFNHIPYKGPAELNQAMAASQVESSNLTTGTVAPLVRAGKLRLIAVVTGEKRSQFAGDTPSFAAQGFELDFRNWLLFVAPKGVPNDIVRRWNLELNKALKDSTLIDKVTAVESITFTGGTPEELSGILEKKRRVGAELAKLANLKYE
ncbi:MAG: Bug family tripartite tricarboxylate transporter substrate binding protein [Burkholderiales bacterium]